MEIFSESNYSNDNRTGYFNGQGYSDQSIIVRVMSIFYTTKEDRLRAGIFIGNEGRDWMEKAALILSPPEDQD